MAYSKKLPPDYALDALRAEVLRRQKITGDVTYSHGRLVAEITPSEREIILRQYRRNFYRRHRSAPMHLEDLEDETEIQRYLRELPVEDE